MRYVAVGDTAVRVTNFVPHTGGVGGDGGHTASNQKRRSFRSFPTIINASIGAASRDERVNGLGVVTIISTACLCVRVERVHIQWKTNEWMREEE